MEPTTWQASFLYQENEKLKQQNRMLHQANETLATKFASLLKESLVKEEAIRGLAEKLEKLSAELATERHQEVSETVAVPLCTEATRQYMRIATFH